MAELPTNRIEFDLDQEVEKDNLYNARLRFMELTEELLPIFVGGVGAILGISFGNEYFNATTPLIVPFCGVGGFVLGTGISMTVIALAKKT